MVDVKGIDPAKLLAALVNAAQPMRGGLAVSTQAPLCMTVDVASGILSKRLKLPVVDGRDGRLYFDYVWGRPIKMNLGRDYLDPYLYDRDHGAGAVETIVARLREG